MFGISAAKAINACANAGRPQLRHYSASGSAKSRDWSSAQYLKFGSERTRPARDLLSQVPILSPRCIVDLGCGPGNSTEVLLDRYPDAKISGIDSSPDMIKKAKAAVPQLDFSVADLSAYEHKEPVDLYFSNAVFHWIPTEQRVAIVTRFIQSQTPGSVFAFQVPNSLPEPSHETMTRVASEGPWTKFYTGGLPGRTELQTPQQLYDELSPHCQSVNIWQTEYQHVLNTHQDIVEWVKGTGLKPFVDPLSVVEKEQFLAQYLKELEKVYPTSKDGKVLYKFPRLFVVAVRK